MKNYLNEQLVDQTAFPLEHEHLQMQKKNTHST